MPAEGQPTPEGDEPREATPIREARPSIGQRLSEQRAARGQSLEDVEEAIRVNRLYLQALEEEHYDVLPAPVYARGFMRSYARYLGMDDDEAVAEMSGALRPPTGLEPLPGLRRTPSSMPELNRPVLAIVAAGVALVLIVIAAGMFLGGDSGLGLTGDEDPVATPVATAATGDASPQPTSDAGATVVPDAPEGTVPDFVGVARSTVLEYLAAEGVRAPLVLENADETVPAGQVIRQSPQAGAELTADTIVTLFVSTGPPEDVGSE